jgi:glycosyltransferase involved in cell wall biosynthesis
MGLRVCLVTPFSWSQPHAVNDHVSGLARELRRLGHAVTVLCPSNRAEELRTGRRALLRGPLGEVVAVGPAVPISRRSRMGVPVGVRANLALALAGGAFDVVHGFEPGLPSLSYLALRDSHGLGVASFFSGDRLAYPPGRAQRERLLGRVDALIASSQEVADEAAIRFPGDYRVIPPGLDTEVFRPGPKRQLIVFEWRPGDRGFTRACLDAVSELDGWEAMLLRTRPLGTRPTIPRQLRHRVHVRTARDAAARAAVLAEAAIVVNHPAGRPALELEAAASGAALARDLASGGQRARARAGAARARAPCHRAAPGGRP